MADLKNYGLIESVEQFAQFVDRLIESGKPVGFDLETGVKGDPFPGGAVNPYYEHSMVVGFSFTNSTSWARYVSLAHDLGPNLDNAAVAPLLWKLLNSVPIISHNGAFERKFIRKFFKTYAPDLVREQDGWFPVFSDTMLEAYVEANQPKFGLKALTKAIFDHDQMDLIELFPGLAKNKAKTLRFNILELTPEVISYACEDAAWCLALHEYFYPLVKDNMIYQIEMQIMEILCHMEKDYDGGVAYDWSAMRDANEYLKIFIEKYNRKIQKSLSDMLGEEVDINLGSPAQLRTVLFDKLGMRSAKTTDSGLESTGAPALEGLSKRYPVVRQILDYKEMKRLQGSFLENYLRDYENTNYDGYAHPSYLQAVVPAGRFACSSPNQQNLPKTYCYELDEAKSVTERLIAEMTEEGVQQKVAEEKVATPEYNHYYPDGARFCINFRDFVISKPDHYIIGMDYSQIEVRVLAGVADEPYLKEAFATGRDIHTTTTALILNMPYEEVTKQQRQKGKTVGLGLAYGLGAKALADQLATSKDEAQSLLDAYFARFSNVTAWMESVKQQGRKDKFVLTKMGRKIKIWAFDSLDKWIYSGGERLCINAPIQGLAADIVKIAMIRGEKVLKDNDLSGKVHLVINVHDSLDYYAHDSVDPEMLIRLLHPALVFPLDGFPTFDIDWRIGLKWGSLHEIKYKGSGEITIPDFRAIAAEKEAKAQQVREEQAIRIVSTPMTDDSEIFTAYGFEGPSRFTLVLSGMPDLESYREFVVRFRATTGENSFVLRTPEGDVVLPGSSGLGMKDKPLLTSLFPGVELQVDNLQPIE